MRSLGPVDGTAYFRAVPLLLRNPQIALAPLLASLVAVLLSSLDAGGGDGLFGSGTAGLTGLVSTLVTSFGLAVALLVAETAWRRGRAPFDEAWEEARRKAGSILLAALGFSFIVYVAGVVGSLVTGFGAFALTQIAAFFFIYTIPASAIGGIPGGAALQNSLEVAKRAPLATLLVTAVHWVSSYVPFAVLQGLFLTAPGNGVLASRLTLELLVAVVQALVTGYYALVLSKAYDDASYGRFPRW